MGNQKSRNKIFLKKEQILALDIATHTGYYCEYGYGTWNFTETKKKNDNKQHKDFRDTVMNYILHHSIIQVVAEDINVNSHFSGMRKLAEFRGILLEICDELDIPEPYFINVTTLKKWATGSGKAKKEDMIRACIEKYHFSPPDDNVADACHLFNYYLTEVL